MSISDSLISVVIPTLNEERLLPATLRKIRERAEAPTRLEIIVADGGSTDNTRDTAQRHRAIVITDHPPPEHRAAAMNLGAKHSVGKVVLFLHADVRLPKRFDRLVREALVDQRVVGGYFPFSFEYISVPLWLSEKLNRIRQRAWGTCGGDQAVFVRREVFEAMGGFPDVPCSEDARFVHELRSAGRMVAVKRPVRVSVRHYQQLGAWRALLRDLRWWWRDHRGMDTTQLAETVRRDGLRRVTEPFR